MKQRSILTRQLPAITFILLIILSINGYGAGRYEISGNLTGALGPNVIYHVVGPVIIPVADTLIIREGVELIFTGNFTMNVLGELVLEGTAESRIVLRGGDISWGGIIFQVSSSEFSRVSNCDIYDVRTGITCNGSSPTIEGNNIYASNVAINCYEASPRIINNHTLQVLSNDDFSIEVYTIQVTRRSNPVITGNERIECITASSGIGAGIFIYDHSAPDIQNNWIEVTSTRLGRIRGIIAQVVDSLDIKRNIISLSSDQESIGIHARQSTSIDIYNNDIIIRATSGHTSSGIVLEEGSDAVIINNIIVGNGSSVGLDAQNGLVMDASGFNCLWQHGQNYLGNWLGNEDVYDDPMFENFHGQDYHLRWIDYPLGLRSPCIDAGARFIEDEEDTTRSDIGRFPYVQTPQVPDKVEERSGLVTTPVLLSLYPNPFNNSTSISIDLQKGSLTSIAVVDISGRQVSSVLIPSHLGAGKHNFLWDAQGLGGGAYYIILNTDGKQQVSKAILLR